MTTCQIQQAEENQLTAQERFNKNYITSIQIQDEVGISRHALHYARKNGKLPEAVEVQPGVLYIWERTPELESYLQVWKLSINFRRGN